MTSLYDALSPTNFPLIRYVDLPRDAVPVRPRGRFAAIRRIAVGVIVAAALLGAAVGFALGGRPAPGAAVDNGPVPGEFRLGPGNQQPPGIVNPLVGAPVVEAPVVDSWVPSVPPVVAVPLSDGPTTSDPEPGEFRLGPGNQQPPGVVNPPD